MDPGAERCAGIFGKGSSGALRRSVWVAKMRGKSEILGMSAARSILSGVFWWFRRRGRNARKMLSDAPRCSWMLPECSHMLPECSQMLPEAVYMLPRCFPLERIHYLNANVQPSDEKANNLCSQGWPQLQLDTQGRSRRTVSFMGRCGCRRQGCNLELTSMMFPDVAHAPCQGYTLVCAVAIVGGVP